MRSKPPVKVTVFCFPFPYLVFKQLLLISHHFCFCDLACSLYLQELGLPGEGRDLSWAVWLGSVWCIKDTQNKAGAPSPCRWLHWACTSAELTPLLFTFFIFECCFECRHGFYNSWTCGITFWPFLKSSGWWWLISSMSLTRTSCRKTTHAHDNYGAWPGWVVSISVLPLTGPR